MIPETKPKYGIQDNKLTFDFINLSLEDFKKSVGMKVGWFLVEADVRQFETDEHLSTVQVPLWWNTKELLSNEDTVSSDCYLSNMKVLCHLAS